MGTPSPADFVAPDFGRPLDVSAGIAQLPLGGSIRGMYLQSVVDLCAAAGRPLPPRPVYTALKDYPLVDHVRLVVEAARLAHPDVPVREGLRRIGRGTYDVMAATLIGRVVFGVLGKDIARVTRLVAKAYEISGRGMTASLVDAGEDWSHVRLEGHTCLVDSYHVGAFEGVLRARNVEGEVRVHELSPTTTDFFTVWKNAPA